MERVVALDGEPDDVALALVAQLEVAVDEVVEFARLVLEPQLRVLHLVAQFQLSPVQKAAQLGPAFGEAGQPLGRHVEEGRRSQLAHDNINSRLHVAFGH